MEIAFLSIPVECNSDNEELMLEIEEAERLGMPPPEMETQFKELLINPMHIEIVTPLEDEGLFLISMVSGATLTCLGKFTDYI